MLQLILRATAIAVLLSSLALVARADDPQGWGIDYFGTRSSVVHQRGRGLQSQAAPDPRGRGSEALEIVQPLAYARIRQNEDVVHDAVFTIDAVSSASTQALDAVSSASLLNEALTLDVTTRVEVDEDTRYAIRWGGHDEENFGSGFTGLAFTRDLADDNATLTTSVDVIVDTFKWIQPDGDVKGFVPRLTMGAGISMSQLLSPTTILSGGYQLTAQTGHLETPYNIVAVQGGDPVREIFPRSRERHSIYGGLRQAIPDLGMFLAVSYRFYFDSTEMTAHTVDLQLTKYLVPSLWVRAEYRLHSQSAIGFFAERLSAPPSEGQHRTSDSDLAELDAHEVGASLRWFYELDGAPTASSSFVEAGYSYYERSNDLVAHFFTFAWNQDL